MREFEYDSIEEVHELVEEGKKIMKDLSPRERADCQSWQDKLESDLKAMKNQLN